MGKLFNQNSGILRIFASPYYGSGSPLSPCPGPLLLFPSIYSGQQLLERAQRELTASQTSAQQCKCSDNGSPVTDHLVPVFCGDNLYMHRKFSPSRTSLPCCTCFCHLCRSPDTSWALLIPSACALFMCICFCLENGCWETLQGSAVEKQSQQIFAS